MLNVDLAINLKSAFNNQQLNNSVKTINLPKEGDLDFVIGNEIHKLPSEAAHNYCHRLSNDFDKYQEKAKLLSLSMCVLAGLSLSYRKQDVAKSKKITWVAWVKENCEFNHTTATKHINVLKHAMAGNIEGLDPSIIPTEDPEKMGKELFQEHAESIGLAMQGYPNRRQLYLALDMIKTPQAMPKPKKKGEIIAPAEAGEEKPDDGLTDAERTVQLKREDANIRFRESIEEVRKVFKANHHQHIHPDTANELLEEIEYFRSILKPLAKS